MIGLGVWIAMARKKRGYDARRAKRIGGIKRVIAYALVVSLLLGLGALHRAHAAGAEAVRGVGRDLEALADVLGDGRELHLNGEVVFVSSSVAPGGVKETLDRFEEACKTSPTGTYRDADDDEGAVACGLDQMRYVYAKRTKSGATHVLAAWTDRRFRAEALVPKDDGADTPGTDSAVVPRPAGARRLLTAEVAGTAYAVRIYETKRAPREVVGSYDDLMTRDGWERLADDAHPGERSYVRGGVVVTMVVATSANGATTVTIAEL